MNNTRNKFSPEVFRIGWFGRIVSVLLSAVLLVAILVFGAVALAVAVAFVAVIGAKIWWLQRQAGIGAGNRKGDILDADYEVIATHDVGNGVRPIHQKLTLSLAILTYVGWMR